MGNKIKSLVNKFKSDETGAMTVEFSILFPMLLIIFATFIGYSLAMSRQAMIINYMHQVARAYAVGYFVDETAAATSVRTYLEQISANKDVDADTLSMGTASVVQEFGFVTVRIEIPMLRLVTVPGMAHAFRNLLGSNATLAVRAPIEGRA